MSKKFRVAFLLSIIINVLLAGVILGALPHRFIGGSSGRERFRSDIDSLPEPARSRFRATIDEFRKSPLRRQMSEARNEAIRLLIATPFDEAAYDRQVNRINELRKQMTDQMSKDMKGVVRDLPTDQRSAIAEILKRSASGQ